MLALYLYSASGYQENLINVEKKNLYIINNISLKHH